jgi:hypothetical protein
MLDMTLDHNKVLAEQAETLGIKIDGRWSSERTAEEVAKAQAALAAQERKAFEALPKTPVRLRRNAFPVADMKARKGDVVNVPIPLAKAWIETGVAERADPFPGE